MFQPNPLLKSKDKKKTKELETDIEEEMFSFYKTKERKKK